MDTVKVKVYCFRAFSLNLRKMVTIDLPATRDFIERRGFEILEHTGKYIDSKLLDEDGLLKEEYLAAYDFGLSVGSATKPRKTRKLWSDGKLTILKVVRNNPVYESLKAALADTHLEEKYVGILRELKRDKLVVGAIPLGYELTEAGEAVLAEYDQHTVSAKSFSFEGETVVWEYQNEATGDSYTSFDLYILNMINTGYRTMSVLREKVSLMVTDEEITSTLKKLRDSGYTTDLKTRFCKEEDTSTPSNEGTGVGENEKDEAFKLTEKGEMLLHEHMKLPYAENPVFSVNYLDYRKRVDLSDLGTAEPAAF